VFKRFMRSHAVQITVGWLVAAYMQLVRYTTRWEIEREDVAAPIIENPQSFIGLTWHSRFMMLNAVKTRVVQKPHLLISRSRDGAIVTHATHFLGMPTVRGSAKRAAHSPAKGGAKASRDMMKVLEGNNCMVITPDGPRGPRQRLGDGPIRLAKLAGVPILHAAFSVRNRKQFDSWDRFVLPLPFGRGKIVWGTPVTIPPDADDRTIEHIRKRIESEMNILLADADRSLGHEPVEPTGK